MSVSRLPGARGMSLAEMLVSLALLSIIMLVGTSLLIRMMKAADSESGRGSILGGDVDVALDLMERDLRDAVDLPRRAGPRRSGSRVLIVELPSGDVVAYEAEGSRLLRWTTDPGPPARWRSRPLLSAMRLADFHHASPHLVEIALRPRTGPVRQRAIVLRNVTHGPGPDIGTDDLE